MVCARTDWTVGAAVGVVILSVVCGTALGRDPVKLAIRPQKATAEVGKYPLLPPPASLIDGDAVPWYEKAVKALPNPKTHDQVSQYLKMSIDQLPADQAEQVLKAYIESFKCVAQAVKCRQCNWPALTPGASTENLEGYRRLAFGIRLWARLELSNAQYDGALLAIRTGFGMAKQLGQAPDLARLLLGVASAESMCREIEQLVQMEDSPNLYAALVAMPKPVIDPEMAIEAERKAAFSQFSGKFSNKELLESQMKPAHDRTRVIAKRMDSNLTALLCVEAIRSYAASHGGQLPQALAEITEVSIPKDPMCGAAFRYSRTGATVVLESTAPAGGEKKDEFRYEITVKN